MAQAATPNAQALAATAANAVVASRPAYLHASAADGFVQHAVIPGEGGAQYVPYERTYQGMQVIGGDFVLETDSAGHVIDNEVAQTQTINLATTTPTVTAAQSQAVARAQLTHVATTAKPAMAVLATGTPRLVWNNLVTGDNGVNPSNLSVYVDAQTGKVLGTQEHILFGDGDAAYNGPDPVHIDTTKSGATFSMKDPTITNLSCQDFTNHTTFTRSTDVWGNGNATSEETDCVDSLFAAQTENKMLHAWDGRNAQNGTGGAWPIRVGLNEVNAFFDGTQVAVGHNNAGDWIGALDVVGHEMGHGVDSTTPGGISGNGTQEFVADTFGAATEWFANESAPFDVPDFTVGEQINLTGTGPIRVMFDPSQVSQPDCYSSAVPRMEVHAASGPGDHWFYLLAEGNHPTNGQPVSPTCNNSTVTGLGIQNAEKIMYNAMLLKTSSASYLKYRTWTLKAAKTLFPNDCTEFNTVKAAWNAVSVPAQTGDPTCTG
jgi:Zn-dependent metalloprotease